ncbi:putative DNA topoisomerase 3-alpha [Blattamonas nauphoetae]|uniref:DNA topoisomerase n=1 Tax=Blattamonas nauphoetae TaxID=2049346 RepID=A0ABQ9XK55_9EUKA|nr:putative DNA topoisomerase 3-alpha [Blattamonas nauphoetae]
MVNVLSVAEKPSVAQAIASALADRGGTRSRPRPRNGASPLWEINTTIQGQPVKMTVTSVRGHVFSLSFPRRYQGFQSCDPIELFDAPVEKVPSNNDIEGLIRTLEVEAKKVSWIILWLDCDREGENISFEVLDIVQKANPRLKVSRARFSSVIPRELVNAVNNLGVPNELDSQAADARSEIDLRIGYAFTRLQTNFLRQSFPTIFENTVSYGPCQFPTLGFVVDRYWKATEFKPEQFWTIDLSIKTDDGTANFNWHRVRIYDHHLALVLYEICCEINSCTVTRVIQRQRTKLKPLPLSTVTLQKQTARLFHIGAQDTMNIAEGLYSKGYISYPRTETDNFTDSGDVQRLVGIMQEHPQYGAYARRLLQDGEYTFPRKGKNDDKAHPPIHPTKSDGGELDGNDKRVYDYICRHFLACCSKDALGAETTIFVQLGAEEFTSRGLMVLEKGYLDIFTDEKWSDHAVPLLKEGDVFVPSTLLLKAGQTSPPPFLSETELITLMDKTGIGTDATIAQHISTIIKRGYAEKDESSKMKPTKVGLVLVDAYDLMGFPLFKPFLRAQMEFDMNRIAKGSKRKDEVLRDSLTSMRNLFAQVKQSLNRMGGAVELHFPQVERWQPGPAVPTVRPPFPRTAQSAPTPSGATRTLSGQTTAPTPTPTPASPPALTPTPQVTAPIALCPVCGKALLVKRKKRDDGVFMSFLCCSSHPLCKTVLTLPQPASLRPAPACHTCGATTLSFVFEPGSQPDGFPVTFAACAAGCDQRFTALLKQLNPRYQFPLRPK